MGRVPGDPRSAWARTPDRARRKLFAIRQLNCPSSFTTLACALGAQAQFPDLLLSAVSVGGLRVIVELAKA